MMSSDEGQRRSPSHAPVPKAGTMNVPLRAHFVWFGAQFPWVNLLAVRSAALRGGFTEVVLHHDSDLQHTPYFHELISIPNVRLQKLVLHELFDACAPYSRELAVIFDRLQTPATRSDLVRFALMYSEGGVYIDMDTVTVRELMPLCAGVNGFLGQELIVYPEGLAGSNNVPAHIAAAARSLLRSALRIMPRGWLAFRRVERLFHLAVNPAILAASPRSPFITQSIEQMLNTPVARQPLPCVLGPHLLQKTLATYVGSDIVVHPPEVFFPLPPEVSSHWFRHDSGGDLDSAISANTRIVHWYASVRTKHVVPRVDPAYVRKHARTQLFSALALPFTATTC